MPLPQPPLQAIIDDYTGKFTSVWQSWLTRVQLIINAISLSGPTGDRPTQNLFIGQPFFDTTLNFTVWWDGSKWVNASGVAV